MKLSDSAVFRGSALPTREASLNSDFAIFGGRVVLSSQFDYRGGHLVDNSLEQFRCFSVARSAEATTTGPLRSSSRRWRRRRSFPEAGTRSRSSSPAGSSS